MKNHLINNHSNLSFMHYQITTQQTHPVLYSETAPPVLKKYAIPGARAIAGQGAFGNFLFQELPVMDTGTSVWYNNYVLQQEEVFSHRSLAPNLSLHFALSNHFSCNDDIGLSPRLHQGHFNLYYQPYVKNQVCMTPGRIYSLFSVYFSAVFLERWVPACPALAKLLQKAYQSEPAVLCPCNQVTSVEMGKTIHEILGTHSFTIGLPYYTSVKINELFFMVVDKVNHCPSTTQRRLHRGDVQRFSEMKEVLLKSMDRPLSLKQLSRQFGINVKKIKEVFKLLYEKSPFDFLLATRMEKAKELLRGTNLSIEDIGENVGYDNRHSFSKAFRKYAGQPPASYRKYKNETASQSFV